MAPVRAQYRQGPGTKQRQPSWSNAATACRVFSTHTGINTLRRGLVAWHLSMPRGAYLGLAASTAIAATVDAVSIRCAERCRRRWSRRRSGELGHNVPTAAPIKQHRLAVTDCTRSHSAHLQQVHEGDKEHHAPSDRVGEAQPLAGDLLGVSPSGPQRQPCSWQPSVNQIYRQRGIAPQESNRYRLRRSNHVFGIQESLINTVFVSRKLSSEYNGSPSRPDPDDL